MVDLHAGLSHDFPQGISDFECHYASNGTKREQNENAYEKLQYYIQQLVVYFSFNKYLINI